MAREQGSSPYVARSNLVVATYRQTTSKMWPYIRKTESVAELKMRFVGNQNVNNGIGVPNEPVAVRTPRTSTRSVGHRTKQTRRPVTPRKMMIKGSTEDLSLTSKNSSRVKDLIKKLNEGSQQSCLQKKNGPVCLVEAHRVASTDAPRTDDQDTLDVRRKAGKDYVTGTNSTAADPIVSGEENKLLPQTVDLETMYSLLSEKHTELLRTYNCMQVQQLKDSTLRKDKREIQRLSKINSELSADVHKLQIQLKETAEHNELLEFRLLELEDIETTSKMRLTDSQNLKNQNRETTEDMSDSGVMSLTTSDDFCSDGDQHENELDVRRCDNIKQRLMEMYNSVCYCVEDRSTIYRVLALIRQFECHLTSSDVVNQNDRQKQQQQQQQQQPQQQTVDCLQESGIFEEDADVGRIEAMDKANADGLSTDLTEELRKLSRIREKIEERKVVVAAAVAPTDDRVAKELSFYREHWRTLERKIEAYESAATDDGTAKLLAASVVRESRLSAELRNAYAIVDELKERNRLLEEEKCEFEEAENDTRLKFQKLEHKYATLSEKKNALQTELAAAGCETEALRQRLLEVDAKKCEARKHAATMEALVGKYEQRNFELEESEVEAKCKLQMLESAWPAVVLWNVWRAACAQYRGRVPGGAGAGARHYYQQRLRTLAAERADADKRIRELEFKEAVYRQTLQQADGILTGVEDGYKRQIEELNAELADRRRQLVDNEHRMRASVGSRDRETELLDRIHGLETEARDLVHRLKVKDGERQSWARREAQLRSDIEQLANEAGQTRVDNAAVRAQLAAERVKLDELRKDVEFKQSVCAELEEKSAIEAKNYQSAIVKLTKQIDEFDVTNGELKEEVETLEAHVKHLRKALADEKEARENETVVLNQELSRKQEIIDSLERHMSYNGSKNAAEELRCENLNTINVGKLNLEQIDDSHRQNITGTLQLSNTEQSKVSEEQRLSKCQLETTATKRTACHALISKKLAVLEAKNAEKNKIIMTLADGLLRSREHDVSDWRSEFARDLDAKSACAGYAPDFDGTVVKRYLDVGCCSPDEKSDDRKYVCLIGPDNPIGLHVVRQIGPDGIIVAWKSPQSNNTIESFELFLNGKFAQRIRCPGRTTAVLCPVDLRQPLTVTMHALNDHGEALPPITVHHYPFVV